MIPRALQEHLATVAQARVLLVVSDYDGTLSPIVDNPAAASPDVAALAALVRIGQLADTHAAIVSGRSLATLRRLTGDPKGVRLIGTHGAETAEEEIEAGMQQRVESLTKAIDDIAAAFSGAEVEPKPLGAAFHYRNAVDGDTAAMLARAVGEEVGARAIDGKMVVEFILRDVDKGVAVATLRRKLGADAVVFLGDDTTDEDVFAVLNDGDVGVKVGPEPSLARYRVALQSDIAPVLETLETARVEPADSADPT